jgi:hypothetical protein
LSNDEIRYSKQRPGSRRVSKFHKRERPHRQSTNFVPDPVNGCHENERDRPSDAHTDAATIAARDDGERRVLASAIVKPFDTPALVEVIRQAANGDRIMTAVERARRIEMLTSSQQ